jgi:hypothetical protein
VGHQVGELTVKARLGVDAERPSAGVIWLCECQCGADQLRSTSQLTHALRCGHQSACPRCLAEVRRGKRIVRRQDKRTQYARQYHDYGNLYTMQEHEHELAVLREEFGLPPGGFADGLFDDPDVETLAADQDWEFTREGECSTPGVVLSAYGEDVAQDDGPMTLREVGKRDGKTPSVERVRQIVRRAQERLAMHPLVRELMEEYVDEATKTARGQAVDRALGAAKLEALRLRQEEIELQEWRDQLAKKALCEAKRREREEKKAQEKAAREPVAPTSTIAGNPWGPTPFDNPWRGLSGIFDNPKKGGSIF